MTEHLILASASRARAKLLNKAGLDVTIEPAAVDEEEVKQAYALARAAFTIEDLLRYTEVHIDLPAEQVLNEMEEAQKRHDEQTP